MRSPLPSVVFVILGLSLLPLSAWTFISNDRLVACTIESSVVHDNDDTLGCVTANANEYERQNWIAGILGAAGFASLGVPMFRRMRARLSEDRDEVERRLETERQLEAERTSESTPAV